MQEGEREAQEDARCRAALWGAALGDALSFPYRDYSRQFLQALARPIQGSFAEPRGGHLEGAVTAHSQALFAVARSIAYERQIEIESIADFLVPLWRDQTVVDSSAECREAFLALARGAAAPEDAGLAPGRAGAGALPRAIPVGLWLRQRPGSVAGEARRVIGLSHRDPRVLACGAALASACRYAVCTREIVLGPLLDEMSEAAAPSSPAIAELIEDLPRLLTQTDRTAREMIDDYLPDPVHSPRADGASDYAVSAFFLGMYHFLKSPEDHARLLGRVLRTGGAMGPTVVIASTLGACRVGPQGLNQRLLAGLERHQEIEATIDDFIDAYHVAQSRAAPPEEPESSTEAPPASREDRPVETPEENRP